MKLKDIKNPVVREQAETILSMFKDFNIGMTLDEVIETSRFTHIQMKMVKRRKMKEFEQYHDDLCYALGVSRNNLKIHAPVQGKTQIGVSITKVDSFQSYSWSDALDSTDYKTEKGSLVVPLGLNENDENIYIDITKLPHAIISGASGSGRTVLINSLISSLIINKSPDELQLVLIDPKRCQLTHYNDCPHTMVDSIFKAKTCIQVFRLLADEMERRYDILQKLQLKDIEEFHSALASKNPEDREDHSMPYILVVVDEIADMVAAYPSETETGIARLAQMSRAVGIHLLISTQRPNSHILTSLLKANIPSRIALQVASESDSITILDQKGAESLLGKGDLLYLGSEMSKPIRLLAPYISDKEIERAVLESIEKYPKSNNENIISLRNKLNTRQICNYDSEDLPDDKYEEAKAIVIKAKKASTSYLQRRMSIGYSRSAKLIDLLEENNIIGPSKGSKAREVYKPKD